MPRAETVTVTVERVGVRGDGIAHWQGETVYLPFTAPGDVMRAKLGKRRGEGRAGEMVELVAPGQRAQPACQHFGACGGCALQHLDAESYRATKMQWLAAALAQHGLAPETVAPLRLLPPATRRRARFALGTAQIGFHARGSHRLIDVKECAVLHPMLVALLPPLRKLARTLLPTGATGAASATIADNGIDLLLDLPQEPDLARLEAMAEFATAQDLARLSWRSGEISAPLAVRRKPQVSLSGVAVDLPEDAFLQPSHDAEAALSEAVSDFAGEARSVADLYAGLGTFSFALARRAKIRAVEGAAGAAAALVQAVSRAGLAGTVAVERRDLAARPLAPEECAGFDAVVFDPPYAGAAAQCRALALGTVQRLVAVSCNPASFARDARLLVDGGYRLVEVRPFDAFVWSANLELVALFTRG